MNEKVVKRNLELVEVVMNFIWQNPDVLDRLPTDFRLVILPEDDPELSLYNLTLLSKRSATSKPVVMVRLQGQPIAMNLENLLPQLYIPLAV